MGRDPTLTGGLIGAPPARPLGARALVSLWFLVLTGGLGAWDAIDPPRRPSPIGQEGVHFTNRRLAARVGDGSRMRIVDEDLERRSNLKTMLTPWYAGALLQAFDEAGTEVVVGTDGWLFLESRVHPPKGELGQIASVWANVFDALDRQLTRRKSRLVVMPVPVRSVVCRDRLPAGFDPGPGLWDPFSGALETAGVDLIDLRPAFAEHPTDELFYREDTHWSRHAQFVAARAAREHLDSVADETAWQPLLASEELGPDKQGLLTFAGLPIGAPARDTLFPADQTLTRAPLDRRLGRAKGPRDAPLALIGTSYSVGEHFLAYLRALGTTPVRNGAHKGFPVWDSLRNDLREHRPLASTVVVEMMTSHMAPNGARGNELFYMGNQFGFLTALEGRPGPSILPKGSIEALSLRPNHRRMSLGPGQLLTTADGVVSLRLQRPPDAGAAWDVSVTGEGVRWGTRWPADMKTFHIPLIGHRPGSSGYVVELSGPGVEAVDPNAVRVVPEHEWSAAVNLALGSDPDPSIGGSSRWYSLESNGPLDDDLALDYRQGNWEGDVRFELVEADGMTPIQIAGGHLGVRGRAVLDLAPYGSRSWAGLRVTTANLQPTGRPGPGAHAALVPLRSAN